MATPTISVSSLASVYFLGIGGIGMSALARWFLLQNVAVAGYDKTPTSLTLELEKAGMKIHYDEDITAIPHDILANNAHSLVIYTPAIPATHSELIHLKDLGIPLYKRSEILGWLVSSTQNIAVAGTHGKTTTSSMVAHICFEAGNKLTAFLGGITQNYKSNLITTPERTGTEIMVVEADEYDRSFLTLFPHTAIITSTDADHLDIYGKHEALLESFQLFANNVKAGGNLLIHSGLEIQVPPNVNRFTYGINEGDFQARDISIAQGNFIFNWYFKERQIGSIQLEIPGLHNVANALAAASACYLEGIEAEKICLALDSCKGVVRRFQYYYKSENLVVVDDYAHHPTEITAFLGALKQLYPNRRIVAIFQPHLFSRTRDFAAGFSKSLSIADCVYLLPIYPARELPIAGITSELLLEHITSTEKHLVHRDELLASINIQKGDVIATIGAGDIDVIVKPLAEMAISIANKWN